MFRRSPALPLALALLLASLLLPAPVLAEPSGVVMVYHAGSLTKPLQAMEKAFEAEHPGIDIQFKGGGSTKMARLISDKGESADIMASADYVVIDKNLIPDFASWNVRFASNRMVLCYTLASKHADEVGPGNWHEVLQRPGVSWGHSDPNLDPAGYRAVMVLQLAEKFLGKAGLFEALMASRPAENVLPKAIQLVERLKDGTMDYAWEYRSVAVQHGLEFVELDDHINLGDYAMDPFYKMAQVEVTGAKEGTTITRTGASITYGVTLLDKAPNPEAATLFLAYLFDPKGGLQVLESMGQPPFVPVRAPSRAMKAAMPAALQGLVDAPE